MKIHVNSHPMCCSVMAYDEALSHGNAEASNMSHFTRDGRARWYLNRLKVRNPGHGQGAIILKKLQETLAARDDFQELIVEPGGYGSDVNRLIKFYESHGFVRDPSKEFWVWTNPSMPKV